MKNNNDNKRLAYEMQMLEIERKWERVSKNTANAHHLPSCEKCNYTGYIHKSIYALGPGYRDEADPHVYCDCKRGLALNPNTNYLVT